MEFINKIINFGSYYFPSYTNKKNTIQVLIDSNKKEIIDIDPLETIEHIKIKINEKTHIPYGIQRLFYQGFELDNSKTLSNYKIDENSLINLEYELEGEIVIIYHNNKRIKLGKIKLRYTVEHLKIKIEDYLDIHILEQRLFYNNYELENDKTLMYYNFKDYRNNLELYIGAKNGILIHIKFLPGEILKFSFLYSTTIGFIKERISENINLPPDIQTISFNGKNLEDQKTLYDYYITNKSLLNVNFKSKNGIIIFIKRLNEKIFPFDINSSETILNIKKLIGKEEDIPIEYLIFKYKDNELDNDKTLLYYNIPTGSAIDAYFFCYDGFSLFIRTLTGKIITIYAKPHFKVRYIKEMIKKRIGSPLDEQRLVYAGRALEDNRNIEDYNIQKESTIHMVLRLRGGKI